jgi:hypothetical protein
MTRTARSRLPSEDMHEKGDRARRREILRKIAARLPIGLRDTGDGAIRERIFLRVHRKGPEEYVNSSSVQFVSSRTAGQRRLSTHISAGDHAMQSTLHFALPKTVSNRACIRLPIPKVGDSRVKKALQQSRQTDDLFCVHRKRQPNSASFSHLDANLWWSSLNVASLQGKWRRSVRRQSAT